MSLSFHNTVGLEGNELEQAIAKCKSQEEIVMAYFKSRPMRQMTASFVYNFLTEHAYISSKVPITSIRRAMSNLSYDKLLRKSENKVPGPLGMVEHEWVYEPEDSEKEPLNIGLFHKE